MQLYGLLHDAAEAFVCDMPKPVKELLPQYKNMENEIQAVIWESFCIPSPTAEEYAVVKKADEMLLAYEIGYLMRNVDRQPRRLPGVKGGIDALLSFEAKFAGKLRMPLCMPCIPRWYIEAKFIKTVKKLIKQTNLKAGNHP